MIAHQMSITVKELIGGDNVSNIQRIRSIASNVPNLKEIYFNPESKLISFLLVHTKWRINVYYTTGTVGTCIEHPELGKTQMFRRNVDYTLLGEIFRNPRVHTGTGYFETAEIGQKRLAPELGISPDDEEAVLREYLSKLLPQVDIIQARLREIEQKKAEDAQKRARAEQQQREAAEAARLAEVRRQKAIRVAAVAAAEEARLARERAEREERERERANERLAKANHDRLINARGTRAAYRLNYDTHFPETMTNTRCVAISGSGGYVAVSDLGSCSWHGIPSNVTEILKRQQGINVDYIAIGPCGEYFIRKRNGKQFFSGSDEFISCINNRSHGIKFVTFAEDEAFYVEYDDSCEHSYNLHNILPSDVLDYVNSSRIAHFWFGELPSLRSVHYTPYCITCTDGTVKYDNLPRNLQDWFEDEMKPGNKVKMVLATSNNDYLVRYS